MSTKLSIWTTPSDYGGFDPVGDICVAARSRDSDALTRSNYAVALRRLCNAADLTPQDITDWDGELDTRPAVYDWRAGHWAAGWVEYLMIRADAPQAVLDEAQAIADALADYPVLDEDHWSTLEYEEACDYWISCSIRDRVRLIKDSNCGCSIFAARRGDIPEDDDGSLYEYLR